LAKTKVLLFSALVASCLTSTVEAADGDAAQVARRFCAAAGDAATLRELMTEGLAGVIAEAEERNRAIAAAAGSDAAPLADGVPYKSMAEEAACAPTSVSVSDNLTIVDIAYTVEGGRSWTDRLVLKKQPEGLRIDDILFASFPTDTYQAGLRRVLADTFDQ